MNKTISHRLTAIGFHPQRLLLSRQGAKTQCIGYRLSAIGCQLSSMDLKSYLKFTI
jgi:hypothetical protein